MKWEAWNPCNSTLAPLEMRQMTFLKQISLDKVIVWYNIVGNCIINPYKIFKFSNSDKKFILI